MAAFRQASVAVAEPGSVLEEALSQRQRNAADIFSAVKNGDLERVRYLVRRQGCCRTAALSEQPCAEMLSCTFFLHT